MLDMILIELELFLTGNIIALGVSLGAFALLNNAKSQTSKTGVILDKDTSNDMKSEEPKTPNDIAIRPSYAAVENIYLNQIMTRGSDFVTDNFGVELQGDNNALHSTILPVVRVTMVEERLSDTVMMENSRYSMVVSKNRFEVEVSPLTEDEERGKRLSNLNSPPRTNVSTVEMTSTPETPNPMRPSEAPVSVSLTSPTQVLPLPFIPDMLQLFYIWVRICAACAFANILSPTKWPPAVIGFQISACVVVFISCTFHRMQLVGSLPQWLQLLLQSPVIFTPPAIFLVLMLICAVLMAF